MSAPRLPSSNLVHFVEHAGAVGGAVEALIDAVYADDGLDAKTRELVFLGIQGALGAESAIRVHVPRAIDAGATRREILSAIAVAVPNGGILGPMVATRAATELLEERGL